MDDDELWGEYVDAWEKGEGEDMFDPNRVLPDMAVVLPVELVLEKGDEKAGADCMLEVEVVIAVDDDADDEKGVGLLFVMLDEKGVGWLVALLVIMPPLLWPKLIGMDKLAPAPVTVIAPVDLPPNDMVSIAKSNSPPPTLAGPESVTLCNGLGTLYFLASLSNISTSRPCRDWASRCGQYNKAKNAEVTKVENKQTCAQAKHTARDSESGQQNDCITHRSIQESSWSETSRKKAKQKNRMGKSRYRKQEVRWK
jgi:hypothetical protein